MTYDAIEDFAGPGGWDEGAKRLGLRILGTEHDLAAVTTARAAGHTRIHCDATEFDVRPYWRRVPGYIASPPCQAWSQAGLRKGEDDREACHRLADRLARGETWRFGVLGDLWHDDRSPLVCLPVLRVRELEPEWVALEEVKEVLGLWEHFARIFERWGYSVWTGIVNAADYGVPQTRRRALLIASRTRPVGPPVPTHAEHPTEDLFGAVQRPWVSMREAIGWGFDAPAATITAGGSGKDSGPEMFGNAAYRQRLAEYVAMGDVVQSNGAVRPLDSPAPTITSSMDNGNFRWVREDGVRGPRLSVAEAGVLQSFRADYPWTGTLTKACQQVGNAIPPLLATHYLAAAAGEQLEAAIA